MIYSYADYLKIAKVGDVVRAVKGKENACANLSDDGSNTGKITKVMGEYFWVNDCCHFAQNQNNWFLELVSPRVPTWETLQVNDMLEMDGGNRKVLAVVGDLFAYSIFNMPDRFASWMTKEEARSKNWSLVTPPVEPEVQEMTVEDVSKLVGKKVKIVE